METSPIPFPKRPSKMDAAVQDALVRREVARHVSRDGRHFALEKPLREVKDGVLHYVATDGMRLAAFSCKSLLPDSRTVLDGDLPATYYPKWQRVIPDESSAKRAEIVIDPAAVPVFKRLARKDEAYHAWLLPGGAALVDAHFVADVLRNLAALAKFGPLSVCLHYTPGCGNDPLHFTASAGDWTYEAVLMPMSGWSGGAEARYGAPVCTVNLRP